MVAGELPENNLDPAWTERAYGDMTGEDFLGLRAVSQGIVAYLLPGITTITPRARYFPFYSWLLVEYSRHHPPDWSLNRFIRRREQIFVLANIAYSTLEHQGISRPMGLTGSDRLIDHWNSHIHSPSVPLTVDRYVSAEAGGFGAYAGVFRALHLTKYADAGGTEVLPRGQHLAASFARQIEKTAYFMDRTRYDTAQSIPRDVLEEYGRACSLDHLADSEDCGATMETLFGFNAQPVLPTPDIEVSHLGNMRGALALYLDILDQAKVSLDDRLFRRTVAHGLCTDFADYQPATALRPFLAHWRMFQLREYYVYGLYSLWIYFLSWLRLEGPATLAGFRSHLNDAVDLEAAASQASMILPPRRSAEWRMSDWLAHLLDAADIPCGDLDARCKSFAEKSQTVLNEDDLLRQLDAAGPENASIFFGISWLLLSSLYLRLRGLRQVDPWRAWYWARAGGERRRSLHLFVQAMDNHIDSNHSVLDVWKWLVRDYLVAQHIITALDKWKDRNVNTFRFDYQDGVFQWLKDDGTGWSASRFRQAIDMLRDLGQFEDGTKDHPPQLTPLGKDTLRRVLESMDDNVDFDTGG